MACRQAGCALLASGSVQEAQDLACVGQMATLKTRVPFLHFFDGVRTSHEINKIARLSDDDLAALIDWDDIAAHRDRALIGANDIVNPSAMEDPKSPIAGMPVLEVWNANTVIVLKRSMASGYAGISNPLYFRPNTRMLFGDAGQNVDALLAELESNSIDAASSWSPTLTS